MAPKLRGWAESDSDSPAEGPGAGRGRARARGRGRGRPKSRRNELRLISMQASEERDASAERLALEDASEAEADASVCPAGFLALRPAGDGFSKEFALAVRNAGDAVRLTGAAKDLHDRCCNPEVPRPMMTLTAECENLGYKNTTHVHSILLNLGAAVWYAARCGLVTLVTFLLDQIDKSKLAGIAVVRYLSQDDTQHKLQEAQQRPKNPSSKEARKLRTEQKHEIRASDKLGVDMKVGQTEVIIAFLYRDLSDGSLHVIETELVCGLNANEQGTAELIIENLERQGGFDLMEALDAHFRFYEMSGADRGAPGLRAEKLLRIDRSYIPRLAGNGCAGHNVNLGQTAVNKIMKLTTSAVVAIALCENRGGGPRKFRRALAFVLCSMARPFVNTVPPAADSDDLRQRDATFDALFGSEPTLAAARQRAKLESLFACRLDRDHLDVYLYGDINQDDVPRMLEKWADDAATTAHPTAFRKFPRNRWVTGLDSVDSVQLLREFC